MLDIEKPRSDIAFSILDIEKPIPDVAKVATVAHRQPPAALM